MLDDSGTGGEFGRSKGFGVDLKCSRSQKECTVEGLYTQSSLNKYGRSI